MKKCIRWMSLVIAITVVLSITALAGGTRNGMTITDKFTDSTVEFAADNDEMIHVTVTSSSIKPENQYLIVMVKGLDQKPVITESNILYIDQKAAANNGTLTFDLYPSSIENSVILIAGVFSDNKTGPVLLAIVNGKYIFGDVNGDGEVNAADASLVLRYSVKLVDEEAGEFSLKVADVNKSGGISSADASIILQYAAMIDLSEVFPGLGEEV